MKYKNVKITALFLLEFGLAGLQAQESVNTTGGDASGSGGTVGYSIGQVVYTSNMGTGGFVVQGVQQPFEIMVEMAIEDAKSIRLSVSAYPNPTNDYLILSIDKNVKSRFVLSELSYRLYDMNGKLLQIKKLTGTETQIDMSSYGASSYFVRVISGSQTVKTFKILKY